MVVPKRLAKRAVTRNLVRRHMRVVMGEVHPSLPSGCWVVRLHAPIGVAMSVSARSALLASALRRELLEAWPRAAAAAAKRG